MFNLKSVKTQLIIYLAVFALILAAKERDWAFLGAFVIAVSAACLIEALILYLKTKSFAATESSIITGMIIGYVVSSDEAWWKFIVAALCAVVSKHLIRFEKKHIFNPAAFGILFVTLVFGVSTQWKGTYLWYVLAPFGVYFAQKIRKMEIVFGYAVVSLALFGAQAFLQKVPLVNIFGYFSYFYLFVMVIEPKTTPFRPIAKYLFGAATAALVFVLTEAGVRFDVELFSLLAMNMVFLLLGRYRMRGIGVGVVSLLVFVFAPVVYAHPPSDIAISFDSKTKMLSAVITHNTSNPMNHYIKKVDVGINGKEIIEHLISKEDDNQSQRVSYLIPDAKDGDVISVEGYCSVSGKLKKDITIKIEK